MTDWDDKWDDKFEELKLYYWCEAQKIAYEAGELTKKQIRGLESIPGWTWEADDGRGLRSPLYLSR